MLSAKKLSQLRQVFSEVLGEDLNPEATKLEMGSHESWDSFSQVNLMIAIESEFEVEFESDEIAELTSWEAIVMALSTKLIEH